MLRVRVCVLCTWWQLLALRVHTHAIELIFSSVRRFASLRRARAHRLKPINTIFRSGNWLFVSRDGVCACV